jgi:hypothetical protein
MVKVKYQSEGLKKGEPPSHVAAVEHVMTFLRGRGWIVGPYTVRFSEEYKKRHRIKYDGHTYDIGMFSKPRKPKVALVVRGLIEIGGVGDDTKHSKKQQKINDGVAERYARTCYPDCLFARLNKDDVFYNDWLEKKLFGKW